MLTTPDEIWQAVATERTTLANLLESISAADWDRPSLCDGWRVRDVVAHVVLSGNPKLTSLVINFIRARGNVNRLILDTSIRYAEETTPQQLLAELRATIPLRVTPPGTTPTDRLMDLLVHIQDIALPLARTVEMPTPAARLAIDRVWKTNWLFHAQDRFSSYRLTATDANWSVGTGPTIEGPIADLLLLTTGRTAKLSALTGAGAALLAERGAAD